MPIVPIVPGYVPPLIELGRTVSWGGRLSTTSIQRPVMLIAAHDDPSGAFDALQQFARDFPNPFPKVYAGDAHGTNLLSARPGSSNMPLLRSFEGQPGNKL